MGLDNFWVYSDDSRDVYALDFDPPLRLCGGMCSANGSGSFRGKVYEAFIEATTGESLYQDRIPNERIKKMATLLESVPENDIETPEREELGEIAPGLQAFRTTHPDINELRDLKRMFRAYADAGAALVAWW